MLNTLRRREAGTNGQTQPVKVSQSSVKLLLPIGMSHGPMLGQSGPGLGFETPSSCDGHRRID